MILKHKQLLKPSLFFILMLFVLACEDKTMVVQEEGNKEEEKQEINTPDFDEAISLGETTGKKVASFLTGTNAFYSHEIIGSWDDENKINYLKEIGISAFRYPGGQIVRRCGMCLVVCPIKVENTC